MSLFASTKRTAAMGTAGESCCKRLIMKWDKRRIRSLLKANSSRLYIKKGSAGSLAKFERIGRYVLIQTKTRQRSSSDERNCIPRQSEKEYLRVI